MHVKETPRDLIKPAPPEVFEPDSCKKSSGRREYLMSMTETMNAPVKDPLSTRYSLLSRLQNWEDRESWMDFFDTYWRLIHSVARRAGLSDDEAQEVVQETVISVAKNIHKFRRDHSLGSFKSWLRNIIRWRIADQFECRGPARAEDAEIDLDEFPDETGAGLEAVWDDEWKANLFNAAIERVKRRVRIEHYLAFDLYVVKQLPVTEVARRLGVTIGHVYVAKHRISALIKKEIRALEQKPF
jgi:RNA polymerase sigma factor (sigma-70 family)